MARTWTHKMTNISRQQWLGCAAAFSSLAFGCGGEPLPEESVGQGQQAMLRGTLVSAAQNPATVTVYHQYPRACSGTLLRPNWVLTARHCVTIDATVTAPLLNPNLVSIGPPNEVTPWFQTSPGVYGNPGYYPPYSAIGAYRIVDYDQGVDLALIELWSPMVPPDEPSCDPVWDPYCVPMSAPLKSMGLWNGETHDLLGQTLRMMGFGRNCGTPGPDCTESNGSSGAGYLRMGDATVTNTIGYGAKLFSSDTTPSTMSGDSGGPSYSMTDRLGRSLFNLASWHEMSSNTDSSTASFRAWIKRNMSFSGTVLGGSKPDIALVGGAFSSFHWASSLGNGSFNRYTAEGYTYCDPFTEQCTTHDLSSFGFRAQQSGVRPVGGDFGGDNRLDIALVGGSYSDMLIATPLADGKFLTSYVNLGLFHEFAQAQGARPYSGDFNGDGRTDIALVGGSGWGSIPVAFAKNGSFVVTNTGVDSIPYWSTEEGVKVVTGDFDGDGRDDIALAGGLYWNSIRIAHSNGDGSFTVTTQAVNNFPYWAYYASKVVAGDFNGDGRDDIALTGGSGWGSIPVAFSAGGGSFWISNKAVNDFPVYAQQNGAKAVAGDFDGDGREDIALTGGLGWNTLPVAFSAGDGSFRVTNSSAGTFPSLAQDGNATPFAVDGGGPKRTVHPARDIVAARNADGRIEIVYTGTDGQMYRNQQLAPGAHGWSGEMPIIGGTAKKIALAENQDGRLELFFIGLNDAVYHLWQHTPNGVWSGGEWLGGWAKEIAVARNQDGRLEVFAIGTNNHIYRYYQVPAGGWSGEQYFGGEAKRLTIEKNLAGGLELYVIGTDDGIWRNYQATANAAFSGWQPLGGKARELAVARHQDGRFEVFYIAGEGSAGAVLSVRGNRQVPGGGGSWSGDSGAGFVGSGTVRALKVGTSRTADDRIALYYITEGGSFREWVQTTQNGTFGQNPFNNPLDRTLAVALVPATGSGPLEYLHLGWDKVIHGESPGGTPGFHPGNRFIGEPRSEQRVTVCATPNEWDSASLTCPAGMTMVGIPFASYGTPNGSCQAGFSVGSCHYAASKDVVLASCLGKESCTVPATNDVFAPDPCGGVGKRLYVSATCI